PPLLLASIDFLGNYAGEIWGGVDRVAVVGVAWGIEALRCGWAKWLGEPGLTNIACCNELNASYAHSCGVDACVVTFTVGELSILNAFAGAYNENLPLICIVGGTGGSMNFSEELQELGLLCVLIDFRGVEGKA
ncbi:unnamed protein product, partial [Prunus brigantina]